MIFYNCKREIRFRECRISPDNCVTLAKDRLVSLMTRSCRQQIADDITASRADIGGQKTNGGRSRLLHLPPEISFKLRRHTRSTAMQESFSVIHLPSEPITRSNYLPFLELPSANSNSRDGINLDGGEGMVLMKAESWTSGTPVHYTESLPSSKQYTMDETQRHHASVGHAPTLSAFKVQEDGKYSSSLSVFIETLNLNICGGPAIGHVIIASQSSSASGPRAPEAPCSPIDLAVRTRENHECAKDPPRIMSQPFLI
ncbi:hypothetical protein J6590_043320 [Homalodisca vitripennis]|nr:hypothetical protein J6590_043320 [Homalodisca vitripennis]